MRRVILVVLALAPACTASGAFGELAADDSSPPESAVDSGVMAADTTGDTTMSPTKPTDASLDAGPIFPPACVDDLKNGGETDVDCGGPECAKCAAGKSCSTPSDCASGVCTSGKCAVATCSDGVKNGAESDVDCGGGCSPCAPLKSCTAATDCVTRYCTDSLCTVPGSCRALHIGAPTLPTGTYDVNPGGSPFTAYCDMTSDGGGWTLAFKIDGAKSTWLHGNAVWSDATTFGTNDLAVSEAKLASFVSLPFTEMRIVMRDAAADRSLQLKPSGLPAGATLKSVFSSGTYYATSASRAAWLSVMASGSLQTQCNREGLNNTAGGQSLRIGIFGNQEADCDSCDSRLGIGYGALPASGNVSTAAYDDSGAGGRDTTTFTFGWVR